MRTRETDEAPRAHPKPATVHAAWRRKPRLSGATRGSSKDDLRADAGGRNRAPPGSPRSDEASEARAAGAIGEDNAPRVRLARRSERFDVNRTFPRRVGKTRRGVHRDEEQAFLEKRIVSCRRRSNGPGSPEGRAPRVPEGPARFPTTPGTAGAPSGEGDLARRPLHASDVARRGSRTIREGNRGRSPGQKLGESEAGQPSAGP